MLPKITIDISGLSDLLEEKLDAINSGGWVEGPVREFHEQFLRTTDEHFDKLSHGGDNRGAHWPYYAESSIGKRRPSGSIIKRGDRILQDTGALKNAAGRTFTQISPFEAEFSTEGIKYAAAHNDGAKRDGSNWKLPQRAFQFFTAEDEDTLYELTRKWLES